MRDQLKRILIVTKYRFIGDTLNAVPALRAVKDRWPNSEVTLLSGARACELLQNCPYVDRFVEFDPYRQSDKGIKRYLELLSLLRSQKFELALVLNRSFHSALTAALGGARRRAAWSGFEGRDFMITDFATYDRNKPEAECFLDVFRSVGGEYHQDPQLAVWLTATEIEGAAAIMPKGDFVVGIQPGATHGYKQWPLSCFLELCEKIVKESDGARILLIGGSDEAEIAERFVEGASPYLADRMSNLVGQLPLRTTLAVVAQLSVFVGNDTAIRHAAVASDTLSIGLFGPTSYVKWGNARPPRHVVLSSGSGRMEDIPVKAVMETLAAWRSIDFDKSVASSSVWQEPTQQHFLGSERGERMTPDAALVLERSLNE